MPDSDNVPFKLERDLLAVLCESVDILHTEDHGNCEVLREVAVGAHATRFPDLVLVYSRDQPNGPKVRITYADAIVLAALLEMPATAEELCTRFFADVTDVEGRLARLESKGLARRYDGVRYDVEHAVLPSDLRIVAIEAKLSRWRQALGQAQDYFAFANEAYIALPATLAARADLLQTCASVGVGVIGVDPHGSRVVLEAETQTPRSAEWVRFVTHTISCAKAGWSALPPQRTLPSSPSDGRFPCAD